MGFLDEVVIDVVSGNGGKGCISFLRAKYIPKGGPDGGDGGKGGDVIIRASSKLVTLADFSSRRHFKARNGSPGMGNNHKGKNGEDAVIGVPLGTIISDHVTGKILGDLTSNEQEITVAYGGRGGKGNRFFATAVNRSPRYAQGGIPGETKKLKLILKHLADIGLVGLPNAGKSTLLASLTNARPKIDNYPFTTLTPNLGIMEIENEKPLTIADIPVLIKGSSQGRGLGHRFLKHIERTRFLLHIIDMSDLDADNPLRDYYILEDELKRYNPSLFIKKRKIVLNKIDLKRPDGLKVTDILVRINSAGFDAIAVSALTGEGIEELKKSLKDNTAV
ncbi:MAG: GTPase ObgE [Deltaproteobacteria bacterium]|nr:GTPase ObgE [Deltaproteobacteria bacterium]